MTTNYGTEIHEDTSHDSVDFVDVDFGVTDSKGRKIGCRYRTAVVVATPFVPTQYRPRGHDLAPGEYFSLDVSATRDGKSFGATAVTRYFDTVEGLSLAIENYVAGARKRASKNA